MHNIYADLCQKLRRPVFIAYTVLGDGGMQTTYDVVKTFIDNGADALELAFPFSDPIADGPVIQAANKRSLDAGTTVDDCFDMIRHIRTFTDMPIGVLPLYYNTVLQRGIDKFYSDCEEVGIHSTLVVDLPLEHAEELARIAKQHNVAPIFFSSERSTDERLAEIAKIADGYIYVVSYLGVTGVPDTVLEENIRHTLGRTRAHTDLPLFVGFGINTPDNVRAVVNAGADGMFVATRFVKEMPNVKRIGELCKELSLAIQK